MASLLELVEALVRDPQAKAAYSADPDDFLGRHGFGGLEPSDLEEALHHAADSFPPASAAQVSPADGLDSLVHVDLQELGFDDELHPLDPTDDGPGGDTDDWRGPDVGDDVEFDAPFAQQAPAQDHSLDDGHALDDGHGPDTDDGDDPGDGHDTSGTLLGAEAAFDAADAPDTVVDQDRSGDGSTVFGGDGDGVGDDLAPSDALDPLQDDGGPDGNLESDDLRLEPLADADSDWSDDSPFGRPALGPDGDDPWFYSASEPALDQPDDVDDDILDDVDDFHHDG